jgi:hypothetical protein
VFVLKIYRQVPTQIALLILFQVLMLVAFRFTSLTLLGAYIIGYMFCILWGNIGYQVLSDAIFCLITVWFCEVDNFGIGIDLCFWYLLFTLVPGILIVYLRNALIIRFRAL